MSYFQEDKPKKKLELLKKKEEEESVKILSQKYKIPYADLTVFPVEVDAIKVIPEEKAKKAELVVFQLAGKNLKIGVRNPEKESTKITLKRLTEDRYNYNLFLTSRSSLEHAWELYKKISARHTPATGTIEIQHAKISSLEQEITNLPQVKEHIEKTFFGRTTEALEIILAGALSTNASDIHIEPGERGARLRFRLDGVLQDVTKLPPKLYSLLLSRLKLLSELKLNIKERAQDGRFTIKIGSDDKISEIEIRTSALPGPHGENVVLRILNPHVIEVSFEKLGMQPWIVDAMEKELKRPNGMILTTGPTGSGKTTTLYAFLRKVYEPGIKIITIEDPIEYNLSGIEQTQIDKEKGYNFASGLGSILRQDPDMILVGEIRNLETAETAMHAALTGHLVFSTLHTNNAAGTIPRLLDLGVKPAIIAPAINVTMAQRLIRVLCPDCRIQVKTATEELKKIQEELANFPKKITAPDQKNWTIFRVPENGCIRCNHTGYKNRIGVFEIILIDDGVERLILKEPSEFEIKKEAQRQGQITMRQDGILKILAGIIDFAELERVVGLSQ